MPQIPNPVPSVQVADTPLPKVSVNTPEAAFGGATAAAITNLGRTIEGSGNELFARAISLKNDDNLAEAKEADTKYMEEAGKLHAEFDSLKGGNAPKSYEQLQQDLGKARTDIRENLSNPAAKRLYDSSSLGTMGRTIFNGANHAAAVNKRYQWDASAARVETFKNQVYQQPDNRTFDASISGLEAEIGKQAALGGWDQSKYEEELAKAKSEMASHRILGMARNDPNAANQLADEYKKKGLLQGRDVETVGNKVQSFTESIGTNEVAQQVLSKYTLNDGTFSKSAKEMRDEAVAAAKKLYPDNPKIETATVQNFDKNYSAHNYIKTQDEREVRQQVSDYIVKGVTDTKLLPADLLRRMSPQDIKDFPAKAVSYHSAVQKQTNDLQYRGLLGLYNEDNAKFMDTDIMKVPGISKENINFFLKLQRSSAADGDPRVSRAMGWLKGANPQILDDLQVTGKSKDPAMANQFVGALHEAIQSYQEINGKAPTEQIVTKELFPAVTRKVTEKGFLWNSQTPFFQSTVPAEYSKRYLTINPQANETEIRRDYNRQMFDRFFSGQKANKDQGRVGQ